MFFPLPVADLSFAFVFNKRGLASNRSPQAATYIVFVETPYQAGIIGLQTALLLLEQGLNVTIISKDWPGDEDAHYTSMWAGAQWRSNPEMDDLLQQDWDRQTFVHWAQLVKTEPPERLGIEMKPAVFYWDHATPEAQSPEHYIWWTNFIPSFKILPPDALPINNNFASGISYETLAISPPIHLQYLLSACIALGAQCCTKSVQSITELFATPDFEHVRGLVNCTGLGAGKLVNDPALFPTKGQTVIVKGQAERIATRSGAGWEALVIPRPGANETLLGGCKIAGDWGTDADESMTKLILDRCRPIAPELLDANGEFEVLSVKVGLRPSRHGGPRMEVEMLDDGGMKGKNSRFVCHNYGHGSAGYEGSVGTANTAVNMVLRCLEVESRE